MGKLAFFIDPVTGSLKQFDHATWNTLIEEAPPGWSADAYPALFSYVGNVYLRYRTGGKVLVSEIKDFKTYQGVVDIETRDEAFSNVISHRGTIMWLGRVRGTMASYLYRFNGRLTSQMIVTNAAAAETTALNPAIGGTLFSYDSGLFYAPRGLVSAGLVHNHLFKIDPDTGRCVVLEARINPSQQYDLSNPWPAGQDLARTFGFCRGVLTAASHEGDLFVLNVDGTLDRLSRGSFERTRVLDLRSAPGMLAGQTVYNMGGGHNMRFTSLGLMAQDGGRTAPFLGGRADLVQGPGRGQSGTIAASLTNPKNGYTDVGLLSPEGIPNVQTFMAGTKIDIRYGFVGCLSGLPFIPGSAQMISSGDALYIITGVGGSDTLDKHAPLMVTRWKSGEDPKYICISDHGLQSNVESMDCFIDEEGGMLHILWTDRGSVRHALVDIKNWVQRGIDEAGKGHVTSGCLFDHTPGEPYVMLGTPEFNPVEHITLVPFTVWATGNKDLTGVSALVEYDIGQGWKKAFGETKMSGLTATKSGTGYVFAHMVIANLNDYVGPVQYRIRVSIK